jgi:hypothetical protein
MPEENYESLEGPLIGTWKNQYKIIECLMQFSRHVGCIGNCTGKTSNFGPVAYIIRTDYGVCYASKVEKVYE